MPGRFQRQELIASWNQERLGAARVAVYERGWLGTFVAWALASLGVGTILWLGRNRSATATMASWLLGDPRRFAGSRIHDYPFDAEYGPELSWAIDQPAADVLVVCTEDPEAELICRSVARGRFQRCVSGVTSQGGSVSLGLLPAFERSAQDPVPAMIVAAVLVDAVRELLCPLAEPISPALGALRLETPSAPPALDAVLVGLGGVGVYAATVLAALGHGLHLVDFDRVEESNLNRQGLFSMTDARDGAHKALAARRALQRLFPHARLSAEVRRVGADFRSRVAALRPKPSVILSAVDNAQTRIVLQELGRELGMHVIQGSTDVFAADCFTQVPDGPTLDVQMHGALTEAARREGRTERRGGCAGDPSYVVPGMMAGALMAYRLAQVGSGRALPPIRWRSGSLPVAQGSVCDGFNFNELTA
jgi:molybdopterin/thiamine biosynthesis adenylyltransferase